MAIEFNCPACGQTLCVGDEHAGKVARCPQCQAETDVPTFQARTPTPAPPAPWQNPSSPKVSDEAARALELFAVPPGPRPDGSRPDGGRPDGGGNPFGFTAASPSSNPYAAPQQASLRKYPKESRGQQIVILASMSYVGCFFAGPAGLVMAIVAWAMAQQDLTDIQLGLVDPASDGAVQLGRALAVIHVILWVIGVAMIVVLFGLIIALDPK